MKRYIGVNKKHVPMDASRRLSMTDHEIQLCKSIHVRSHWDEAQEKWYFSVVDVVQVLTDSTRPRKYWSDLKVKLQKEGSQLSEEIGQLKMKSPDGRSRATDAADVPTLLA
jgi:DNA-damage-inducible protein D